MRLSRSLTVLLALGLLANLAVAWWLRHDLRQRTADDQAYTELRTFNRVLRLVRQQYVDEDKIGYPALLRGAIRGLLGTLDVNSTFLPPPEADSMREQSDGQFGGIGVHISVQEEHLTILSPMENSPGQRAGLQAQDQVTMVNGQTISGLSLPEAIRKIKGKPGTPVTLTIFRPGTGETLEFIITRELITVDPIQGRRMLAPRIGYAHLSTFSNKSAESLWEAMLRLRQEGMAVLILDLRHNPGGLLGVASTICGYFLPPGELIVTTEGRLASQREVIKANDDALKAPDLELVILINEASASAAEIVAGSLQDYRRATVVGQRSYGKGSVQKVIPLDAAGALRLTVARYYTPSRRQIDGHGIDPDVVVPLSSEESLRLHEARGNNGTPDTPSPPDPQLSAAIEIAQERLAALAAKNPASAPGAPVQPAPESTSPPAP